jgi:hypothetical protein
LCQLIVVSTFPQNLQKRARRASEILYDLVGEGRGTGGGGGQLSTRTMPMAVMIVMYTDITIFSHILFFFTSFSGCVFVVPPGLSPRKELLRALLAGDEEKAIEIYVLVSNGKSLQEDLYPSLPLLDTNHQTPMHLVSAPISLSVHLFFWC